LIKVLFENTAYCTLAIATADVFFKEWKRTISYFRAEILKKAANYIRTNVEAFAKEILLETENSVESHKVKIFISLSIFKSFKSFNYK
jgi:succinate-semialdehyde dehydrogenase/glutarate-semialdehyde dehydrogenase